jgi:peptidoglycan/xylan/chitin deacetylase (PgdA/CDA1 family)
MPPKRILLGYGVDLDAVSGYLNTTDGTSPTQTNISRGIFGATTGLDRLLSLFARHNITATFFVPGHTLESFPASLARVRDAGHEIGLHGYTHEFPAQMSAEQQRDVLGKSIAVLTAFTGTKPLGYTAPAWAASAELIPMLSAAGIKYDHSFMHHDFQPYWAPDTSQLKTASTNLANPAASWMRPMSKLHASNVVEIPANWNVDDWPPLQPSPGRAGTHGYVDVESVEKCWKEQFSFAYEEYDEFIFPISVHPQVSGKGHVMRMHERFIQWVNGHEGEIVWMPFGKMAEEFAEGRIKGVQVEGGVEVA